MAFEEFERGRAVSSADPTVRVSPDGKVLSLNPAAMELFGEENGYALFLFDKETRQLAIEPRSEQTDNTYAVTGEKNGKRVNCFALVRVNKIRRGISMPARKQNRWLVMDVGPEWRPEDDAE